MSPTLFGRCVVGFIDSSLVVLTSKLLPLTTNVIILNLSPFIIMTLSHFVLNERFSKVELGGMVLSFTGVFLIVSTKVDNSNNFSKYNERHLLGMFFSLMSAITVSLI